MLDQSLSGIMAAVSHGANTELAGYPYDRRTLDAADITIAFAHPFTHELGVPSTKQFRLYTAILAYFDRKNTRTVRISELEKDLALTSAELINPITYLEKNGLVRRDS